MLFWPAGLLFKVAEEMQKRGEADGPPPSEAYEDWMHMREGGKTGPSQITTRLERSLSARKWTSERIGLLLQKINRT